MRLFFHFLVVVFTVMADAFVVLASVAFLNISPIWNEAASIVSRADERGLLTSQSIEPMNVAEQVIAFYEFETTWAIDGAACSTVIILWKNFTGNGREFYGASVSSPVARSIMRDLAPELSLRARAREMFTACQLERRMDNLSLLRIWLAEVYIGSGEYGVDAAARSIFGKSFDQLDINEAAHLAALIRVPGYRETPTRLAERAKLIAEQVTACQSSDGFLLPLCSAHSDLPANE